MRRISGVLFAITAIPAFAGTTTTGVKVPILIDDNRITVEAVITSREGRTEKVRAWVDSGNPDMWISANLADRLGLAHLTPSGASPIGKAYLVETPNSVNVSGFKLAVPGSVRAIAFDNARVGPGIDAEINIPAPVLAQADIEFDYPAEQLGLQPAGKGEHNGRKVPITVNAKTSKVQFEGTLDGVNYEFGLDTGASYSFIDQSLVSILMQKHPDWPNLAGSVGASNIWGLPSDARMHLLRIPELRWGPLKLEQIGMGELPRSSNHVPGAGDVAGIVGGNVLKGFRIDIDYAAGIAYFDKDETLDNDHLDMVGLTLHPEPDGSYSILRAITPNGESPQSSISPSDRLVAVDGMQLSEMTMGSVIHALSGKPGESKVLTLEHAGRKYEVHATVHRFLPGF